jgi:pyrroline-5-carboxylate reductase
MSLIKSAGFLGGGQMASALAGGLRAAQWKEMPFAVVDRFPDSAARFASRFGATICPTAGELVAQSDLIFLCVKPQDVASALTDDLQPALEGKIIVSVVAGLTLQTLTKHAGKGCRICRSMPNTAAEIAKAVTVVCFSDNTGEAEREEIKAAFGAVGACMELAEEHFDAVVAVSGSGPAYACLLVEAMTSGGVDAGLPQAVAQELAAHAVQGAAALILQTGRSPEDIRHKISSPGGTTLAALEVMEKGLVRHHIHAAVQAAAARSRELSKP